MTHTSSKVWVFFYGTIMDPRVLREYGVTPDRVVSARLAGFRLSVRPRPNLVPAEDSCAFGSLMKVAREDLSRIYELLEERFALRYLPEAVMVETLEGWLCPALCYVVPDMAAAPPDAEFVKQLAECVRTMQLPESYATYIESLAAGG